MKNFDESNITRAVADSFRGAPNPRLRKILISLVEHAHACIKETEITFEEWETAIDFLTRTGHMCDDKRQEFILLSDTFGVSMLVDAINHRHSDAATATTVLGPFYVANQVESPCGTDVSNGQPGDPLYVEGMVTAAGGGPIADAVVDIWHSDDEGYYDVQKPELGEATFRGRFRTDAAGRFHFWTIMPKFYPIPSDGPVGKLLRLVGRHPFRPAHVHFRISADGCQTLVTHVFAADSPYLDSDAVFGVKESLIADFPREPPGTAPDGRELDRPWRKLTYGFALNPAI